MSQLQQIETALISGIVVGGVLFLGGIALDIVGIIFMNKANKQLQKVSDVPAWVAEQLSAKQILYGFGHKIYKEADPRVV